MKNLSKVLAVVLSFMLVFTTVGAASYTDVAADAKYDEAVSVLSALNILNGYEDGTFKPDGDITRAEFAAVVCRLLGLEETANGAKGQQVFNDVAGDHWASGYVALASQQGIVNGYGDGNFGPEDKVLYEQAIKMVVAALGYTPMAEVNGGYPGGYQIVAAQRGILANVSGGATGVAATRAIVAQMSYNALEVPIMGQTSFGTDISYTATENLLLNKLNVTKFEGTIEQTPASDDSIKDGKVQVKYERQVTAVKDNYTAQRYYMDKAEDDANPSDVYGSYVSGDTRYKKATINVEDGIKATAESYLDYNVVMYVEDATDSDATLIAVYPKTSKNSDVSFKTKDFYASKTTLTEGDETITGTIAVYTDKDADKYEKHDVDISKVYVNGRQQAIVDIKIGGDVEVAAGNPIKTAEDMAATLEFYLDDEKDADVKLVCNTSGDEFNIVYITDYLDLVVETINEKTTTVVGKESNPASNLIGKVIFDEDEYAGRYSIVKDGAPATFADIKVDDVLSIAGYVNDSRELEYGVVTITSEKANGTVSTYDKDEKTITVGGKAYDYNKNIGEKLGEKGSTGIKLGDEITLYVNARGYVVAMDKTASNQNLKYGFATKAVKSTGVEDSWQMRVLTTDGTWTTFDLASKVSFEGNTSVSISSKSNKEMATLLGTTEGSKLILNKVVAYETNSSNEIKTIYVDAKKDVDEAFNKDDIAAKDYIEATESLGGVFLNDTTAIFSYASGLTLTSEIDEDDISVAKKDSLVNRNEYTATAYGLDDDNYAKVLCGEGLVGEIALNSDFFVISGKSNVTNDDGDEGYNLTGYVAGEEITIFADKADTEVVDIDYSDVEGKGTAVSDGVAALDKGDVVLYSKTANGEADKIIRLVDASELKDASQPGGLVFTNGSLKLASFEAAGDDYCFYLGLAYDRSGNTLKIAEDEEGANLINLSAKSNVTGASVDLFASKIKVKDATAGDVDTDSTGDGKGDVVFVRTQNDTVVEDIVIFEYNN